MRIILLFFYTCILSTIGLFAALSMSEPWFGFLLAYGA